ncbi:MAG: DUF1638 domain-containing protein, partial [Gammaproteobacteria bacterium]|nr:DUF1638 domain-containing protein [Gammaproteobacteria bacterium]
GSERTLTYTNAAEETRSAQTRKREPRDVYVVSCQVLQRALQPLLDKLPELASCSFMDYGLHCTPGEMASELQVVLDAAVKPGIVLLGYGLCGNGLVGLRAGRHTLVIPRTDDCIAILMGSYQKYLEDFQRHPGTYYLSEGWLESGFHPLGQLREWSERHGEEKARQLIARVYVHYQRVVLVAFTPEELSRYRSESQAVADLLGVVYDEMLGTPTLLERLVWQVDATDLDRDEFVVIPPGAEVQQMDFVR